MSNPLSYTQDDFVGATPINTVDMEQLLEELLAASPFASTPAAVVNVASRDLGSGDFAVDVHFDTLPDATDETAVDALIAAHTASGPTENDQIRVIAGTSYTMLPSDDGCRLYFTAATAVTVTVDTGLGMNFSALWRQVGAGLVRFVAGTATLHNRKDQFASAGVKALGSLVMSNVVDTVDVVGDTA